MTTILDSDLLTSIYDYVDDLSSLEASAKAVAQAKHHPLWDILYDRLCNTPLTLASSCLADTQELMAALLQPVDDEHRTAASRVRDVSVYLGPAKNKTDYYFPAKVEEKKDAANILITALPDFFKSTTRLRQLDWNKAPPADSAVLEVLSSLPDMTTLKIDCATDGFSNMDVDELGDHWKMAPFFASLGPKISLLELRNVNEDSFKVLATNLGSMTALRHLRMDLTCGTWDWNGTGSPQSGPSDNFIFPRISETIERLDLIVSDLTVRSDRLGPFGLVDLSRLSELGLFVVHSVTWTSFNLIRVFKASDPLAFQRLTKLVVIDEVWDSLRWHRDGDPRGGYTDQGRCYFNIHEFLDGLSNLRHLWVSERVLCLPIPANSDNRLSWGNSEIFDVNSEANLQRTYDSPQWSTLGRVFGRLETLRVGFGMMNTKWVGEVLKICNQKQLRQFGFDYDWLSIEKTDVIPPELVALFKPFTALRDIHILHPRPEPNTIMTLGLMDAEAILSACPDVSRVGIGRNFVWERKTTPPRKSKGKRWMNVRCVASGKQNIHIPRFYDAGSSNHGDYGLSGWPKAEKERDTDERCEKEVKATLSVIKALTT